MISDLAERSTILDGMLGLSAVVPITARGTGAINTNVKLNRTFPTRSLFHRGDLVHGKIRCFHFVSGAIGLQAVSPALLPARLRSRC